MQSENYSITIEEIREVNRYILEDSIDSFERNLGGVTRDESMLYFLCQEIAGISDAFCKAATVLQKIALRHPFIQGNKRTAFVLAAMILDNAGFKIVRSSTELNTDIRTMIIDEWTVETVYTWLRENSRKRE